jgi:hypothetical protein
VTHLDQRQRLGIGHVGLGDMGSYTKPITKILTNVVDTLGNKIGALPIVTKNIP